MSYTGADGNDVIYLFTCNEKETMTGAELPRRATMSMKPESFKALTPRCQAKGNRKKKKKKLKKMEKFNFMEGIK